MSTDSLNYRTARIIVAYTFNNWQTKTNFNRYCYTIIWTEYDCDGARSGASSGNPAAQARVQATAGITSAIGAGKVLYSDSLIGPNGNSSSITSGGWVDDGYQCSFKPDGYHVQTYVPHVAAWCYSNQQQFANVVITAQAKLLHGDIYGLIFRLNPHIREFYTLEIDSKGEYRFMRAAGNDPS